MNCSKAQPAKPAVRVLVADDSAAVIDRVTELLREVSGAEVAGRAGGVGETLRLVEQLQPDVVILDLQMPDGNGLDILEAIREKHAACKVIVLTNNAAMPVRDRCLRTGADFFLDKSNEFERLPQIIKVFVGQVGVAPEQGVASSLAPGHKVLF